MPSIFGSRRKTRTSTPKRHSSRRAPRKAPKGLSARAKSTIRKTVAAIAGLGGAAALTYAGLFLANQKNVDACLKTGNKTDWDKIHCDGILNSMMTPKHSKELLQRHQQYRILGHHPASANAMKKQFPNLKPDSATFRALKKSLKRASKEGNFLLHDANSPSGKKYARYQKHKMKPGKKTTRTGRRRSDPATAAPSHIKNASVVEGMGTVEE